jgi:class 3 adenylate cyclase
LPLPLGLNETVSRLPSGRVTFAFTDVVGSTRAFAEHGDRYLAALEAVQTAVARCTESRGGVVVKTEGDGAFLAFPTAGSAVAALVEVQSAAVDPDLGLRLRAGAHTDEAQPVGEDYLAFGVHVAARLSSAAGAGQLLVSEAVIADLDEPVGTEIGAYELKDLPKPVTLWRLAGDDTPPRATPKRRTNVAVPRTNFVGRRTEVLDLRRRLQVPALVTVVGPGGAGKTRLVSELAIQLAESYPGGAWIVELAPVSEPATVPDTLRATFAAQGAPEAIVGSLGAALVVLDNCEHVVEAGRTCAYAHREVSGVAPGLHESGATPRRWRAGCAASWTRRGG